MKLFLLILCTTFFVTACTSPEKKGASVGTPMSKSQYNDIFQKYTKTDKKYDGFYQLYEGSVTLIGSALQTAILQRKSDIYLWNEAQAQEARETMFQENSNSTKFLLVLFTPKARLNDLEKHNSIWNTYLEVNGERYPGEAKKLKDPLEKATSIYPSMNRFSAAYEITFKVPMTAAENYPMTFTLTSSLGTSTFNFEVQ